MVFIDVRQRQNHPPSDSQPSCIILASTGFCFEAILTSSSSNIFHKFLSNLVEFTEVIVHYLIDTMSRKPVRYSKHLSRSINQVMFHCPSTKILLAWRSVNWR
jgi:hypothetical protein